MAHDDAVDGAADPLLAGRNETPLQRCDRNLVELLQEVRVIQTGVQVLFAFLLIAPLSAGFPDVTATQRAEYSVSLLSSGAAALLLMAPTAYHRVLFRCGDKEYLVKLSNRYTLAGLGCVAVAMLAALLFVASLLFSGPAAFAIVVVFGVAHAWCWCIGPLRRRRRVIGTAAGDGPSVVALRARRPRG